MTEKNLQMPRLEGIHYASIHVSSDICDVFLNDMKTDFILDKM